MWLNSMSSGKVCTAQGVGAFPGMMEADLTRWEIVAGASKDLMEDNIGRRLENSFWRILRSERVMKRMNGRRLAKQVKSITDGGYIRTTPTGSPRASRNLDNYYVAPLDKTENPLSTSNPTANRSTASAKAVNLSVPGESEDDDTPTPKSTSTFARVPVKDVKSMPERRSNLGRLPPILKKANSGSAGSAKNSTRPSPTSSGIEQTASSGRKELKLAKDSNTGLASPLSTSPSTSQPRRYTATRFNEEVKVAIPKPSSSSKGFGERSPPFRNSSYSKSGKRNPVVKASTGSSKKRPILMRHRSSVSSHESSVSETSPASLDSKSLKGSGFGREDRGLLGQESSTQQKGRARASSPHPSKGSGQPSAQLALADDDEVELEGGQRREGEEGEEEGEDEDEDDGEETAREDDEPEQTEDAFITRPSPRVDPFSQIPSQHRSFTNLPAAAWRSAAVAPAAASYQASGLMAPEQGGRSGGNGKRSFRNDIVPLKAPGPSSEERAPSDNADRLPRTRSQLALLLDRNRPNVEEKKGKQADRR